MQNNSDHLAGGAGGGVRGPLRVTSEADEWSATHDATGSSAYCAIRDDDDTVVALAVAQSSEYGGNPDCRAVAAHIVRCVNSHDELLERVQIALGYMERMASMDAACAASHLRAAIAKAQGSTT